ncbi:MAG: hypothetical protein MZV49_18300 [Rhodopseudomonas palustris]|nr:hypothetical protein [Rhodopseudomonas palustris]
MVDKDRSRAKADWRRAPPALADPVRIVRLEAAFLLADQNPQQLPSEDREKLLAAFQEYEAAERLDATGRGRARLALFFQRRGLFAEAEAEYLAALLEPEAAAIAVNLQIFIACRAERPTEKRLRQTSTNHQIPAIVHHALGLSPIRSKRYDEALGHLRIANEKDPAEPRFAYVYAIALQSTGHQSESDAVPQSALSRSPYDIAVVGEALNRLRQTRRDQRSTAREQASSCDPTMPASHDWLLVLSNAIAP